LPQMSDNLLNLPKFSNNREDYPLWFSRVCDSAKMASTLCQHGQGLLGFILNTVDFQNASGQAQPFEPLKHPGPEPIDDTKFRRWQFKVEQFQLQSRLVNEFKTALLGSLHGEARLLVEDPITGTRDISLAEITQRLYDHYGVMTSTDLVSVMSVIDKPYSPSEPIRDYILSHEKAYAVAERNGQPYPESLKVSSMIAGVTPCNLFNFAIDMWLSKNPQVKTQKLKSLTKALQTHADSHGKQATAGNAGYSAAAVTTASPLLAPPVQEEIARLVAAAVSKIMTSTPHATPAITPAQKPAKTRTRMYCWTHGECGHSSAVCKNKSAGHDDHATRSDHRGGSSAVNTDPKLVWP
jgi:hypothetical protein